MPLHSSMAVMRRPMWPNGEGYGLESLFMTGSAASAAIARAQKSATVGPFGGYRRHNGPISSRCVNSILHSHTARPEPDSFFRTVLAADFVLHLIVALTSTSGLESYLAQALSAVLALLLIDLNRDALRGCA